jgi:hypothetical protein
VQRIEESILQIKQKVRTITSSKETLPNILILMTSKK